MTPPSPAWRARSCGHQSWQQRRRRGLAGGFRLGLQPEGTGVQTLPAGASCCSKPLTTLAGLLRARLCVHTHTACGLNPLHQSIKEDKETVYKCAVSTNREQGSKANPSVTHNTMQLNTSAHSSSLLALPSFLLPMLKPLSVTLSPEAQLAPVSVNLVHALLLLLLLLCCCCCHNPCCRCCPCRHRCCCCGRRSCCRRCCMCRAKPAAPPVTLASGARASRHRPRARPVRVLALG